MGRLVKVRLVRACEMRATGKIYQLGDVLELPEALAEVYIASGDVEQLDEAAAVEVVADVAAEAPAKRSRAKR